MARTGRFAFRLLLAAAAAGGAYLAWVSAFGSPAPADLLPQGAAAVVQAHDAASLARRLSGTRFAADFAKSSTREWLEATAAVKSFDSLRDEVGKVAGWTPGRETTLDLVGAEAAAAWYPRTGGAADPAAWVAAGRLSVRAWAAVTALRIAQRFGFGSGSLRRVEVLERTIYSLPGETQQELHLFMAGRVLVAGSDRILVLKAASCARGGASAVTAEPAWKNLRGSLPAGGELFVWVRGPAALPWPAFVGTPVADAPAGAVVRVGKTVEIDVAMEPAALGLKTTAATAEVAALPAAGLLRQAPLFFLSSGEAVPQAITELLESRRRQTSPRHTADAIRPGRGFALAVTGSAGAGLLPSPRGFVVIGMASAADAARVLPSLYPDGSRTTMSRGGRTLVTRESIPLAGGYDLWGAAVGGRLVFATDVALIDAVADDAAAASPGDPDAEKPPPWRVQSIGVLSVDQALPLLRRWAVPLSGLVAANWPDAPDIARDVELLAAVRTVRMTVGSDERRQRAAIALTVSDRP